MTRADVITSLLASGYTQIPLRPGMWRRGDSVIRWIAPRFVWVS